MSSESAIALRPVLEVDETTLWSTGKSEKLLAKGYVFTGTISASFAAFAIFQVSRLSPVFSNMPPDGWIAILNLAAAIFCLGIFLPAIFLCLYSLCKIVLRLGQLHFAPHEMIYAITSKRVLQFVPGRKNRIEQMRIAEAGLRPYGRNPVFARPKRGLYQGLFARDMIFLGLTSEERLDAIRAAQSAETGKI